MKEQKRTEKEKENEKRKRKKKRKRKRKRKKRFHLIRLAHFDIYKRLKQRKFILFSQEH